MSVFCGIVNVQSGFYKENRQNNYNIRKWGSSNIIELDFAVLKEIDFSMFRPHDTCNPDHFFRSLKS